MGGRPRHVRRPGGAVRSRRDRRRSGRVTRMTRPLTIYAPLGLLGYGYPEASLQAALAANPDLIAVDAGSTDPGPYYLGAGVSFTSRVMVKRDLGLLLRAAVERRIPLVVGSAGGSGAAPHLAWTLEIVREIAAEHDLHFRMAVISADLDRDVLKRKLAAGDLIDFEMGRDLTEADIDACTQIVGQMGYEPIVEALEQGAEVVL